MDNYAIFKMGKLKSSKDLSDAFQHNERIYDVINADPSKADENIELIRTQGLSYEDLFENTLAELKSKGVPGRTVRKDAVKGLEVILTFSREKVDDIDVREWAKKSLEWIDENFNPPNHEIKYFDSEAGEPQCEKIQNIKHAVVHMDESKPHLHAFIVPIDNKGNLNSHYYNSGRNQLIKYHTEYAKAMGEFELVRGEEHSIATPEQMSRYYNHIKKAVDAELPEPKENETAVEYKARAEEVYQKALSNHRNDMVKKNQEIVHLQSKADKQVFAAKKDSKDAQDFIKEIKKAIPEEMSMDAELERDISQTFVNHKRFLKAIEEHPDSEKAEEARNLYQEMIEWQVQQENLKDKKDSER